MNKIITMIQRSIIADSKTLHLDIPLPANYIGKEINLLLYSFDELESTDAVKGVKNKKWKFSNSHVSVTDYKFNRDEANER
jgi:hypothetical protein